MELTVQNVYGLLLRSKLLHVEEAKAMYARWQEEAKEAASNLGRFAAWMVAKGYLTEYQAGLLARGHAEGFFLNDYMILERLGKGRMAGVYKARHRLGQTVAIKVLPPSKAKDPMLLSRFQREAKLALKLRHTNIVRAFHVGEAGELRYLVMEHLDGLTLEELLERRKKVSASEAVRLIYQTLQGLQHIHEQGLVHRDLKPSNLMLIPALAQGLPGVDAGPIASYTVKILDIGLGRELFEDNDLQDPGLTGEGVLLGTPDYMAPEQARDPRSTDIRADIYSLGCVLYHLLAGQTPFPDTNIISQMIRHASEPPRPVSEFTPGIPDGLQQILNWMMAKTPEGRYPTPERAAKALEVFMTAGAMPLTSPDLDPSMRPYLTWVEAQQSVDAPPSGRNSPDALAVTAAFPPPTPAQKPPSGSAPAAGAEKPRSKPAQPAAGQDPSQSGKERRLKVDRAKKQQRDGMASGVQKKQAVPPPPPVAPVAAPAAAAPVLSEEEINVELVTVTPVAPPAPPVVEKPKAKKPRESDDPFALTRRDFILFFAGVGSTLFAVLIGKLLASLLSSKGRDDDPPTVDE